MLNLTDSIRKYMEGCPFLKGGQVDKAYIGVDMKYSIDPLPCSPFLQKYVDGGAKRQFSFALTSQEAYGQDTRINIESSGFFQSLGNWFEEQNLAGIFPELGNDKSPVWAEAVNSGCLYDASGENARYRIECRFIFIQEV